MLNASPNAAVIAATFGLLLIFVELNRPGRILPGASGLLIFLLASASLSHHPLRSWAVAVILLSAVALLLNCWQAVPHPLLLAASLASVIGLRFLLAPSAPAHIHTLTAVCSGGSLGVLGAVLTRIAFHARRAKAVD